MIVSSPVFNSLTGITCIIPFFISFLSIKYILSCESIYLTMESASAAVNFAPKSSQLRTVTDLRKDTGLVTIGLSR